MQPENDTQSALINDLRLHIERGPAVSKNHSRSGGWYYTYTDQSGLRVRSIIYADEATAMSYYKQYLGLNNLPVKERSKLVNVIGIGLFVLGTIGLLASTPNSPINIISVFLMFLGFLIAHKN